MNPNDNDKKKNNVHNLSPTEEQIHNDYQKMADEKLYQLELSMKHSNYYKTQEISTPRPVADFTDPHTSPSRCFACSPEHVSEGGAQIRKKTASFFFDKYARHDFSESPRPRYDWEAVACPPYPTNPPPVFPNLSSDQSARSITSIDTEKNVEQDPLLQWVANNIIPSVLSYEPPNPRYLKLGIVPEWMLSIFSLPNIAIPMSYFCVGIALQMLRTPLIVYFINDLNASAADVNVLFTVMAVPWCFKMFYGLLSDCYPIMGQRRKPYFFTGWLIYVISNAVLAVTPQPSVQMCVVFVFLQTTGYMLADVMTDALIVERSQYEKLECKGTMQSQGYMVRFFGSVIGAIFGAIVYNEDAQWSLPINFIFLLGALFPIIFLVPCVPFLMELDTNCVPQQLLSQLHTLFLTVQLKAVWQPMTFVYIYNAMQLTNPAWMNFLVDGLEFKGWMIGVVGVVGSFMAWLGILAYEKYFFSASWRVVFFWCTTLAAIISLGQILLVFGINKRWGIPDIYFSMGDDVLIEFVIAVQFLPMCIMYLGLCPEGSEGTTYALLTTFSNLAGTVAFDVSTALTGVWDVSSEAIENGDYEGVWKLSLLCGIVSPLPLLLLKLIPEGKTEQRILQADTKRHFWKGVIFVAVTITSLVITFSESWYEVNHNDQHDNYDNQRRLSRLAIGH